MKMSTQESNGAVKVCPGVSFRIIEDYEKPSTTSKHSPSSSPLFGDDVGSSFVLCTEDGNSSIVNISMKKVKHPQQPDDYKPYTPGPPPPCSLAISSPHQKPGVSYAEALRKKE
eukprot:TRINITY_DN2199_c0_g1_i1.p1 TRINITY_DN2199_c0_g1~~TRINITY_DN2199_c0_g1_i1.p1  ORF type:complete len:114 (+),score=38.64 TRINITY_DN2199_c0_g1_i1:133-474(+)